MKFSPVIQVFQTYVHLFVGLEMDATCCFSYPLQNEEKLFRELFGDDNTIWFHHRPQKAESKLDLPFLRFLTNICSVVILYVNFVAFFRMFGLGFRPVLFSASRAQKELKIEDCMNGLSYAL